MNEYLFTIAHGPTQSSSAFETQDALNALESGQVIYLPNYTYHFEGDTRSFFSPAILDGKHKNVSYNHQKRHEGLSVSGISSDVSPDTQIVLRGFMQGYAEFAKGLVDHLFPQYQSQLRFGRTSYRPAEIAGRKSSPRKDDTRVHVDAFYSTPVHDMRLLRVFCNVNPEQKPRVWELGESFEKVLNRFARKIPRYYPWHAKLLHWVGATRKLRSHYDHMMLHLHHRMKLDEDYQNTLPKHQVLFPAQSTWIVFTDQVSHAALSGQHLLEQTFYLPISAMQNPELSPFKQCEPWIVA